ncbi:MAG TPA: alpha-amylase family glycosyl hydrolase [Cytophagaceae bacterium]
MKITLFLRKIIAATVLVVGVTIASYSQSLYWWNDAVFYEIFVRSFKDSDGDGNGDFKGLIEKLDYLNDGDPDTHDDLGITAIWLMPIQQSPSYHGYDVIDYRTIEQDYGTNEDFKNFIAEAHKRGIKVIIDYVMNHTSSQHPWFLESQNASSDKRNWYIWQDTKPNITGPWGQAVWHTRSGSNFYGIFWSEMPDLNYATLEVQTEMYDIARFWLEEMNVDGFRLDAIKYIKEDGNILEDTPETIQFWKDFRTYYKSVNPNAVAVGEAWTSTDKVAPYVNDGGLDFCFEFDLAEAILNTANTGNVSGLKDQMDEVLSSYSPSQYGTFLTNHDINRVMDRLTKNITKAKVAASILLTLPGVPYIYYGEEIGMTGSKPDENIRTPLQWNSSSQAGFTTGTPWRPVNSDYLSKNIEAQQYDHTSLWSHYKRLITIRNNQPALRKGNYVSLEASSSNVFAFLRNYQHDNIIVVTNPTTSTLSNVELIVADSLVEPDDYFLVELQGGGKQDFDIVFADGNAKISIDVIPPRTTFIYKLIPSTALETTITFEVNMNPLIQDGLFDPASETVDIVATFNDFGLSEITHLSDDDEDGIYTVVISDAEAGSKINYKYRINGVNDGREEFSGTSYYREYIVTDSSTTVRNNYQKAKVTARVNSLQQYVTIYPVPATDELFLEFASGISGEVTCTIFDIYGSEQSSYVINSTLTKEHNISCESLTPGVYFITLSNKNNTETFRVVIQR